MASRSPRRVWFALSALVLLGFAVAIARILVRAPVPEPAAKPPEIAREAPPPPSPTPEPTPPATDPSEFPSPKLPLRLLGTLVNEDPALSLATVDDTELSKHEVMKQGQRFEGRLRVQVASIERTRILIDNEGVREQLA